MVGNSRSVPFTLKASDVEQAQGILEIHWDSRSFAWKSSTKAPMRKPTPLPGRSLVDRRRKPSRIRSAGEGKAAVPCRKHVAASLLGVLGLATPLLAQPADTARAFVEVRRFPAAEAVQGVAVDAAYVYAVASRAIGKYDKQSGTPLNVWREADEGPIRHLDSGVVLGGRLYAAHSNYPGVPMTSSIEVWDTATLEHVGTHSFGIYRGSATWVDFYDGAWWVAFAHYGGRGGEPGKDPSWTSLVRFDEQWREQEAWVFPEAVVGRMAPYSNSGGSWGADGLLYVTGHDMPEVYALRLPEAGSTLMLVDVLPIASPGQGIAWDRAAAPTLWSIHRESGDVIASRVRTGAPK